MAEVFFKDLNIWMCVCSSLQVTPLCNMKFYGMNTFKLSDTTSFDQKMETKTLVIVFPLAAGAVGNCSVQWGLVCVCLCLMQKSQVTHRYKYTHRHKLVSLNVFLRSMSICSPASVLSLHIHTHVVWFSVWEHLTGLLLDRHRSVVHPSAHPATYLSMCSNACEVCNYDVMLWKRVAAHRGHPSG